MHQISLIPVDIARSLALPFAVFAVLALATKRRAILSALVGMRHELATNLLLLVFNALLVGIFFVAASDGMAALLDQSRLFGDFWSVVPEPLVLVCAIVGVDFAAYWRHRAEHSASLWRIHATHHADTRMHWLSVQRKHPLGKLFSVFVDNIPVLLLGMPAWAIVGALLIRTWWGYFTHADLPWTLGPLGRIMISPAAHRLHHIRDETLMGSNYGNTVTLWDRVFGTWCDPAPYLGCETGIAEGTRGFVGELWRPFERRYRFRALDESGDSGATAV